MMMLKHHSISSAGANKYRGFTLIEMMLVMVVISMIIVMAMRYFEQQAFRARIDRTSNQMQQILNASLSYYVSNGSWPNTIADLDDYLPLTPTKTLISPWNTPYTLLPGVITTAGVDKGTAPLLYLYVPIVAGSQTTATATIISGMLPLAFTTDKIGKTLPKPAQCDDDATTCYVVTTINIPGQNLNNASAVNYGGIYHNGACVPVPPCPVDPKTGKTMTPEIMVVPVSVSGVNDQGEKNVYPISSFTAYAKAYTEYKSGDSGTGPEVCSTNTSGDRNCYLSQQGADFVPNGRYWRVCLEVVTEKGTVNWNVSPTDNWGQYATIMAITRCSILNEPSGSSFNVWTQ